MSTALPANTLYKAGLTFGVEGGRLWVEPASSMTPELVALVRENKEQLVRIARFRKMVDEAKGGREIHEPEGEPGPPPVPRVPPGRDPMVKPDTEKAKFYRDVREHDLEKRKREGLPPWIRIIDGGAA